MRDKKTQRGTLSRRSLIGSAAAWSIRLARVAVGAGSNLDNLPPNVSEWTPYSAEGGC